MKKYGKPREAGPSLHPDTIQILLAHLWPGNVRELEHVVQAALALCDGLELLPIHLPRHLLARRGREEAGTSALPQGPVQLDEILEQTERRLLTWALRQAQGNQSEAAALLGIPRTTLQYRCRRLEGAGEDKAATE
jgi:arginine utilization regulatory protein